MEEDKRKAYYDGKLSEQEEDQVKKELRAELGVDGDIQRALQAFRDQVKPPARSKKLTVVALRIAAVLLIGLAIVFLFQNRGAELEQWSALNSIERIEYLQNAPLGSIGADHVITMLENERNINVKMALIRHISDEGLPVTKGRIAQNETSPLIRSALQFDD